MSCEGLGRKNSSRHSISPQAIFFRRYTRRQRTRSKNNFFTDRGHSNKKKGRFLWGEVAFFKRSPKMSSTHPRGGGEVGARSPPLCAAVRAHHYVLTARARRWRDGWIASSQRTDWASRCGGGAHCTVLYGVSTVRIQKPLALCA